ncbi:MAG: D-alanine--D-alanine ligase [Promicromonosporaceae bacterium]|nr:D-alanine--D-alanine ligase [Promicromonosporaceae bacterium]
MIRVAVIGGGANGEREVSLESAAAAAAALNPARYDVVRLTCEPDGGWLLDGRPATFAAAVAALASCGVALPLIHGAGGEDGTLAALCDLAGVPYVGCGVTASAIGMDKHATKLLAASVGIRTARGTLLSRGAAVSGWPSTWQGPVVVKPVDAGSSVGVSWVTEEGGLAPALDEAFAWSKRALVEEHIDGREIDIAVFREGDGLVVSAPLEINADKHWDFAEKYRSTRTLEEMFTIPAPLGAAEAAGLAEQARRMYTALGAAGVARFDFFLDGSGWLLNEVNTIPGMTSLSQVPLVYQAVGIEYPELLDRLIAEALDLAAEHWSRETPTP